MNCLSKNVISTSVLPLSIQGRTLMSWWPTVPKIVGATVLFCCTSICASSQLLSQDARSVTQKVGVIETSELSKLVLDQMAEIKKSEAAGKAPPAQKFILVDVRSDREMAISVIPGAISKAEFEKNQAKYSGKVVIPYCTVGGRCADFSRQLAQAGWTVRSYRGSIVEWVQNELPLATPKGESTTQLHTNGGVFKLPSKYKSVPN
jgi:rhodanese-related sulfurtransferase